MKKNIALYLSNNSNKIEIINSILENEFLRNYVDIRFLKSALFSNLSINKCIEEELRHDIIIIHTEDNSSLQTMSSGQKKKALLTHLLSQHPDLLILDDVYSNLDSSTQISFTETFENLSHTTLLIQLFFRKKDVLPCMDVVLTLNDENIIVKEEPLNTFRETTTSIDSSYQFKLPPLYSEHHSPHETLIQLSNVSLHYLDKKVLYNINWTILKGEFWQLVGKNGAGKSTLVTLITGDNPKAYGQDITLFGRKKGSGESIWDIKRQIGYFTPSMIAQFTRNDSVENMIISGLMDSVGLYVLPSDLQKEMASQWMEMLGASFKKKSFQQLSIGQKRMVMVARAMIKQPPLLILDEPTIELDDENSKLFIEMVNAIAETKKIAIIYVSHREEDNLHPHKIFELTPTENGFTGIVKENLF